MELGNVHEKVTIPEGLQKYREFIHDGIGKESEFPIEGRQVIGSKEFAADIFKRAGLEKLYNPGKPKLSLERLITIISDFFRIPTGEIRGDSKYHDISAARRALMYLAVEKLKFSNREISEYLNRSPATVSLQILRVKKLLRKDEKTITLYQTLEKLLEQNIDR